MWVHLDPSGPYGRSIGRTSLTMWLQPWQHSADCHVCIPSMETPDSVRKPSWVAALWCSYSYRSKIIVCLTATWWSGHFIEFRHPKLNDSWAPSTIEPQFWEGSDQVTIKVLATWLFGDLNFLVTLKNGHLSIYIYIHICIMQEYYIYYILLYYIYNLSLYIYSRLIRFRARLGGVVGTANLLCGSAFRGRWLMKPPWGMMVKSSKSDPISPWGWWINVNYLYNDDMWGIIYIQWGMMGINITTYYNIVTVKHPGHPLCLWVRHLPLSVLLRASQRENNVRKRKIKSEGWFWSFCLRISLASFNRTTEKKPRKIYSFSEPAALLQQAARFKD